MKKASNQLTNANLSYELYKELANEICVPINDKEMTLQLRYELYQSKLIYLYNINEQCFRSINSKDLQNSKNSKDLRSEHNDFNYTLEDLINIQNAIEITREFLKQTIRESLNISIASAEMKGLYASRFQQFQKNN